MLATDTKDSEIKALDLQFIKMGDLAGGSANQYTKITGVGDDKLTVLEITHMPNTICIPTEIGLMTELVRLKITGSTADEPIPPEIGLLTKLEILHLNENSLSGPIPEELGQLSESLYDLQLQVNKLTGTVPEFLCDMELKDLKLSFNYLSGTMPTCFSTGRIANHKNPSTYALAYEKKTWTGLRYLHLSANDLTGAFPDLSGQKDPAFKQLWVENNLFEGDYTCGTADEIAAIEAKRRGTDPPHRCKDQPGATLRYSQDPLWRQGKTGSFTFEGAVWDAGLLPADWWVATEKNRRNYVGQSNDGLGGNKDSTGNQDTVFVGTGNMHSDDYRSYYAPMPRKCKSTDPNYNKIPYCAPKYALNPWVQHPRWWSHSNSGGCPTDYTCDSAKNAEI